MRKIVSLAPHFFSGKLLATALCQHVTRALYPSLGGATWNGTLDFSGQTEILSVLLGWCSPFPGTSVRPPGVHMWLLSGKQRCQN